MIIAGPDVHNACARHIRDLTYGPERGLQWDVAAAMRAIKFFELKLCVDDLRNPDADTIPYQDHEWAELTLGHCNHGFWWHMARCGLGIRLLSHPLREHGIRPFVACGCHAPAWWRR